MIWLGVLVAILLTFALYIYLIRPLFEKMGIVNPLTEHEESIKGRFAAFVRSSWTIAWGYITSAAAAASLASQQIVEWLNGPDAKGSVAQLFADRPKLVAGIGLAVTVMFILLRLRTSRDA